MDAKNFEQYIENIDSWIKQIRTETSKMTDVSEITEENVNNIQHNYELICELKDNIAEIRNELNTLKLIQIAALKERIKN